MFLNMTKQSPTNRIESRQRAVMQEDQAPARRLPVT